MRTSGACPGHHRVRAIFLWCPGNARPRIVPGWFQLRSYHQWLVSSLEFACGDRVSILLLLETAQEAGNHSTPRKWIHLFQSFFLWKLVMKSSNKNRHLLRLRCFNPSSSGNWSWRRWKRKLKNWYEKSFNPSSSGNWSWSGRFRPGKWIYSLFQSFFLWKLVMKKVPPALSGSAVSSFNPSSSGNWSWSFLLHLQHLWL